MDSRSSVVSMPLDLADRYLDAGVLDLFDRGADEGGTEVGVAAGTVAVDLGELFLRRRDLEFDSDLTPDGMCIDAEEAVWFASVLTHEVVRVDVDGNAERLPVSQNAYACLLGGEDRQTLFVATALDHEPANRGAAAEGKIEATRVEVPGAGADGIGA
jgi:sugar lactone lactonase YvrE